MSEQSKVDWNVKFIYESHATVTEHMISDPLGRVCSENTNWSRLLSCCHVLYYKESLNSVIVYKRGIHSKQLSSTWLSFQKPNEEQDLYITMAFSALSTGEGEVVRLIGDALIAPVSLSVISLFWQHNVLKSKCRRNGSRRNRSRRNSTKNLVRVDEMGVNPLEHIHALWNFSCNRCKPVPKDTHLNLI